MLLGFDSQLTFIADDWMLLVKRQGWSADYFFHPFHGNVVAAPGLVYQLVREVFGMGSATPYYAVAIGSFVMSALLLFAYVRRRLGDWLALLGAVLILFLGAAFEDLLFAFQIGYFGSVSAGLASLLALDRENERGDRIACALLVVSLAFSSVGIAFVAGSVVDVALGRRPLGKRIYIALVPVALYGLWWLGWGHLAQNHVSIDNAIATPKFVFDAAAGGIVSLLGLATGDGSEPDQPNLIWGKVLLVIGLILLVVRFVREGKIPKGLAVALAIGIAFWALGGLNREESRLPTSSRYQYPSAIFLLLIAAEMLRGLRIPRLAVVAAAAVTAAAVVGGVTLLQREHEERWIPYANSLRSTLAGLEIAGPNANPEVPVFFSPNLRAPAGAYLSAVETHGSPAFDEGELETRPTSERATADLMLAQALGLALVAPDPEDRTSQCRTIQATTDGFPGAELTAGEFLLTNQAAADVEVMLRRFADELSVGLGAFGAGVTTSLGIPEDRSRRPWKLGLKGFGPVRLCSIAN